MLGSQVWGFSFYVAQDFLPNQFFSVEVGINAILRVSLFQVRSYFNQAAVNECCTFNWMPSVPWAKLS